MPVTRKNLTTITKACEFPYAGDTVHLRYYPSALTEDGVKAGQRVQAELKAASDSNDEAAVDAAILALGAWVATIIAEWDFLQDDGVTMQPLTPENLAKQLVDFPEFIQACIAECQQSRIQGNATGTPSSPNSASTSSLTDSSDSMAASLNPSDSSSSPDGCAATPETTSPGS